jgi:hypothetical protein
MSTDMKTIIAAVAELESRLSALKSLVGGGAGGGAPAVATTKKPRKARDPDAPKREPNAWIKFSMRVRALLKENEQEFELAKHMMSFTKHLKDTVGMDVDDAGILAARASWEPLSDEDVEKHREAMRELGKKVIEEGGTAEQVDAAIKAYAEEHLGARALPGASAAAAVEDGASAASGGSGEKKKPGRKPMTEEQKAAAKAEREAKLAAMTAEEKEALAAAKAAKKAARAAKKSEAAEE